MSTCIRIHAILGLVFKLTGNMNRVSKAHSTFNFSTAPVLQNLRLKWAGRRIYFRNPSVAFSPEVHENDAK